MTVILVSGSGPDSDLYISQQKHSNPDSGTFCLGIFFICVIIILKAQPQSIQFVFFFFKLIIVKIKIDFITIYLSCTMYIIEAHMNSLSDSTNTWLSTYDVLGTVMLK